MSDGLVVQSDIIRFIAGEWVCFDHASKLSKRTNTAASSRVAQKSDGFACAAVIAVWISIIAYTHVTTSIVVPRNQYGFVMRKGAPSLICEHSSTGCVSSTASAVQSF